jgi:hypothetical protein
MPTRAAPGSSGRWIKSLEVLRDELKPKIVLNPGLS